MSKTLQQELDEYVGALAEIRKLYSEDGTITPDEKSQLDSLENRIQQLRSRIDSGHGGKQNGQPTAAPTVDLLMNNLRGPDGAPGLGGPNNAAAFRKVSDEILNRAKRRDYQQAPAALRPVATQTW